MRPRPSTALHETKPQCNGNLESDIKKLLLLVDSAVLTQVQTVLPSEKIKSTNNSLSIKTFSHYEMLVVIL